MKRVTLRFYEELNDFLPKKWVKQDFIHPLYRNQTVKDLIESVGVPHVEVDLILVNGNSVDFSYLPSDGDRISVYPVFEFLDITEVTRLRPKPLREIKFILDVHLGKLAKDLRLLGFDTLYNNRYSDIEIALISQDENRTVLTRDRGLLKRSIISRGYCIREELPDKQIVEVLRKFSLKSLTNPLTRCLNCNGQLIKVDKEKIIDRLLEGTIKYYNEFYLCNNCGKNYWKGSHYKNMIKKVTHLLDKNV